MKIISYSLWGDDPRYLIGALHNIETAKKLYPGWICRFYCHYKIHESFTNKLLRDFDNVEVIFKYDDPVNNDDKRTAPGMFWRFDVLKDKYIERCIIRDTDSELTLRERNCVRDWEYSGKEFHIIRDHVMHSTKIMGGMWGATKEFIDRIDYDYLLKTFIPNTNNVYGLDQEFLADIIYPLVSNTACIHDDWDRYKEGARKVPHLKLKNEYCAQILNI